LPGFHNKTCPIAIKYKKYKIHVFGGVPLVKFAFQWLNIMLFGVASTSGHEKQPAATV